MSPRLDQSFAAVRPEMHGATFSWVCLSGYVDPPKGWGARQERKGGVLLPDLNIVGKAGVFDGLERFKICAGVDDKSIGIRTLYQELGGLRYREHWFAPTELTANFCRSLLLFLSGWTQYSPGTNKIATLTTKASSSWSKTLWQAHETLYETSCSYLPKSTSIDANGDYVSLVPVCTSNHGKIFEKS